MLIAIFVGSLSGVIGVGCWALVQFMLNMPAIYGRLEGQWYLVPPAIGLIAAVLYGVARAFSFKGHSESLLRNVEPDRRQPLADLFESFHFGIFKIKPFVWIARGIVSFISAFFGGIFGLEGATLELSFASLPLLSRYMRLFIEEKQIFVICTISAALGTAIGAPFSGALIALELAHAVEGRIRAGAVVASLTAYGVSLLLQSTVFDFFMDAAIGPTNIVGALFAGLKPLSLDHSQWALIAVSALVVGIGAAVLALFTSHWLSRGSEFFTQVFGSRSHLGQGGQLGMIVGGILIGVSVWLVPEAFSEPWRLREDITWLRLSSIGALVLLVAKWGILILAFSSWGSSGLFSPILLLGALWGYSVGNVVDSAWALPLAIAGSAATLGAMFRVPIAAAAMVLEIGRDGPVWAIATLAVASAALLARATRIKPFHELLLERRGIRVVGGRAANVLARLKTGDAMHSDIVTVRESASIQELREAVAASKHNILGVCSSDGKYVGLLVLEQLPYVVRRAFRPDAKLAEVQLVERVIEIRDLVDTYTPTISPLESLEKALALLQKTPCISVVDENGQLCGFLFETSIAAIYKREVASAVVWQS